jgi:hypothetical protein
MARTRRRPRPTQAKILKPVATRCPECGHLLWVTESKHRTITTLHAVTQLTLRIRRCPNPDCSRGLAAEQLLEANPLHLGLWTNALGPVKGALLAPLEEVSRGRKLAERREVAATVLADYACDRPELLVRLIGDADPKQFALLLPLLQKDREKALSLLRQELARRPPAGADEKDRVALAQRQANSAVALLQLGDPDRVWPLLRHNHYPDRRSYLVARLAPLGIDVGALVRRLEEEQDVSARRARPQPAGGSGRSHECGGGGRPPTARGGPRASHPGRRRPRTATAPSGAPRRTPGTG